MIQYDNISKRNDINLTSFINNTDAKGYCQKLLCELKDEYCNNQLDPTILELDVTKVPEIFVIAKTNFSDGYNQTFCL